MRFEQAPLLVVVLGAGLLACKKDADTTAPLVRIVAPVAGSTISVPDTFTVRVEVSDENIVEALTIELVDDEGRTITSAGSISVNSNSGTYATELRLSDERVLSGSYTIVARATDGDNDGRGFLGINVLSTPLRLRALFLAPPFSTDPVSITRIDSAGNVSTFTSLQDFNGVAVDSYWQHVIVAGSQFAPLQALPTSASSNFWQVDAPASDQPEQFTAVTVDPSDRKVYFATREGLIRGFTGAGAQHFTAQCLEGHRCERIIVMQNEIATWQRAIVGGASHMVAYSIAGTSMHQLTVEHDRIELFHRSGTSLIHFANADDEGLIEDVNIAAGGSPEVRTFSGELIRAVTRLDANTFVIALTDRMVRFNYANNTINPLSEGIAADALAYDPATGALYASEGSTLLTIDPNSGAVVNTMSMNAPIAHILPLLNR
ncbi:MAG: hypothetical protein JNM62_10975 [Flavobacteriales bacterium]|nr:hypothetical protein [Flavobacteriales bacterium]